MKYDTSVCNAVKSDPLGFVDRLLQEANKAPDDLEPLLKEAACVVANLLLTEESWQELSNQYLVLKTLCRWEQNEYDFDIFSSKAIAESLEISRYAALKALHALMHECLVERGSAGCPAVVTGGEYNELVSDAAPPVNGFRLTDKARETEMYKNEQTRREQYLADSLERCLADIE